MRRFVLPLLLLIAFAAPISAQVSFKVPIFVRCGNIGDTLFIGVNPGNTVGIDHDDTYADFQEGMMPPLPPPPFNFDARMISLPGRVSTFPTGLGTGTNRDFRGYIDAAQIDSFRIRFSGDLLESENVIISWPEGLSSYASKWTIKPQSGTDWPETNMITDTMVTIPPFGSPSVIIIKEGARLVSVGYSPVAADLALEQNYPNPFNPTTTIAFTLPQAAAVRIAVYNVLGAQVAVLGNGMWEPGRHTLQFDASGLPSGSYVLVLHSGATVLSRSMMLLR